jgi:hypothetical protein
MPYDSWDGTDVSAEALAKAEAVPPFRCSDDLGAQKFVIDAGRYAL